MDLKLKQKDEAIGRMQDLRMKDEFIADYEEGGIITNQVKNVTDELMSMIRNFEEKETCLVYHVTETEALGTKFVNLFFVSNREGEWHFDREDIREGYVVAYVINLYALELSEIGSIQIEKRNGEIYRIA
ncbi:hypothetical protein CDS26_15025 [Listeria monocytogenes]|nr:hypothetical protein [Listeria monocytogenes]